MKSIVTNSLRFCCYLIVLVGLPLNIVRADNSCDCQDPPGGRIKCENDHVAICRVSGGKVYGECKTPPKSATKGKALEAWMLSEVLGTPVEPVDVKEKKAYTDSKRELQLILSKERYTNPETGDVTTFKLPKSR